MIEKDRMYIVVTYYESRLLENDCSPLYSYISDDKYSF